jgi:hypothetical protein
MELGLLPRPLAVDLGRCRFIELDDLVQTDFVIHGSLPPGVGS